MIYDIRICDDGAEIFHVFDEIEMNEFDHSILGLLKEARKGFFGCYSVCETMKDTKEGYFIM